MTRIVSDSIADAVRNRAKGFCEYCRIVVGLTFAEFEIDHIVSRKHQGSDSFENLAWTCFRCNAHKGTDLSSVDPESDRIVTLFHPRKDKWNRHFRLGDGVIHALTPKGRATLSLLRMNRQDYVDLRRAYFEAHPEHM